MHLEYPRKFYISVVRVSFGRFYNPFSLPEGSFFAFAIISFLSWGGVAMSQPILGYKKYASWLDVLRNDIIQVFKLIYLPEQSGKRIYVKPSLLAQERFCILCIMLFRQVRYSGAKIFVNANLNALVKWGDRLCGIFFIAVNGGTFLFRIYNPVFANTSIGV